MARKGHRSNKNKDIYNYGKGSRKNSDFTMKDAMKTTVTLVGLGVVSDVAKKIIK